MLLITCEECEKRTLTFQAAPKDGCPECGAKEVAKREVRIGLNVEHEEFSELSGSLPREDLIFTG